MCGADELEANAAAEAEGSPPRVRSRRLFRRRLTRLRRITSACAEQTLVRGERTFQCGDHLRVCGADVYRQSVAVWTWGSPPRVRSRPVEHGPVGWLGGITSACAEQTRLQRHAHVVRGDHLRVCGADSPTAIMKPFASGSPPRVRSRLDWTPYVDTIDGITSACAEQTWWRFRWV